MPTQGQLLRLAMQAEKPLQVVGTINAYCTRLAQAAGFKAIYLSGAGVANGRYALPDLAMTSMNDVLNEINAITEACSLPLIVDADTGWGSPLNVARTFKLFAHGGAAGAHIEDQTESKRCGHRGGKQLIHSSLMIDRIKAALDGRQDPTFVIIARTDAVGVEGEEKAIERAVAYQQAGADVIFVEAISSLEQYQKFAKALSVPILANITEFGKTPLFTTDELAKHGVSIVLYPLSAFRAMNQAALKVYNIIRQQGTQKSVIDHMQTRDELYQFLDYEKYEKKIDQYLKENE